MRSEWRRRRAPIVVSAAIGALETSLFLGCSDTSTETPFRFEACPPPDLRFGFNALSFDTIPRVDVSGREVDQASPVMEIYIRKDELSYSAPLKLRYEASRMLVEIPSVPSEGIAGSGVGDTFESVGYATVTTVEGRMERRCTTTRGFGVKAEVLLARGNIDRRARTVDANFQRAFRVDVDWNDEECGLGRVRGSAILETRSLAFNCGETVTVVGDEEPYIRYERPDAAAEAGALDADGAGRRIGRRP